MDVVAVVDRVIRSQSLFLIETRFPDCHNCRIAGVSQRRPIRSTAPLRVGRLFSIGSRIGHAPELRWSSARRLANEPSHDCPCVKSLAGALICTCPVQQVDRWKTHASGGRPDAVRGRERVTMEKRLHLTRVGNEKARAWWVRIYRGETCYQKSFADSKYGGCRSAELAARKWRDKTLEKLPKSRKANATGPQTRKRRNNRSGVPGVYRYTKVNHTWSYKLDEWIKSEVEVWVASWYEDGKKRERCWSIRKYGARVAKRLASAHRLQRARDT